MSILFLLLLTAITPPADREWIAVLDFYHVGEMDRKSRVDRGQLSTNIRESLTSQLHLHYNLVERERLDILLLEKRLFDNGTLRRTKAKEAAKIIGAEFFLAGTITEMIIDRSKGVKLGGRLYTNTYYRLTVSFEVFHSTSQILISGRESSSASSRDFRTRRLPESSYETVLAEEVAEKIRKRIDRAFYEWRVQQRERKLRKSKKDNQTPGEQP
ncbi:MAG: CsgG/HfaB family protein [Acidobacteriota bacterium]|nr:CsgG/HfaB family protein [Acidobacteriota bacterium]